MDKKLQKEINMMGFAVSMLIGSTNTVIASSTNNISHVLLAILSFGFALYLAIKSINTK